MRKLIYLFVTIIFISCSEESNPKELPSTTDITCFFNHNNTSSESNNTAIHKSSEYYESYSFSNKITSIEITSQINDSRLYDIRNVIHIDPSKPTINDGITLHGLYTGNNTIVVEIKSNNRVCSKYYTPNSLGEIILKDSDVIPVYKVRVKENVIITPNCSFYLGVFKPCNTAAKFIFSKNTDDDIQYRYMFRNKITKETIIFSEKNGNSCCHLHLELSEEMKKGGVIINEMDLSEIEIECGSRKPGNRKYNSIGCKTIKLVPGECIVNKFTEVDFISQ